MKKLLILLLVLIGLVSCHKNQTIKKPFIIIGKCPYHYTYDNVKYVTTRYTYSDSNGRLEQFLDSDTLYHVGDIIE